MGYIQENVYIVDDDEAVRESLTWLLESVNLNVQAFSSAEEFLESYNYYDVSCLLLDIRMHGMSGLQLQDEIKKQKFHLPVIIITGHGDVSLAVRSMKNGAMEFLEKPFNDQDMLDCIQIGLAKDKINQKKRLEYSSLEARVLNLTPREKEILKLVVNNISNKKIAKQLLVSIKTVEAHRSNLMEKMKCESLVHLLDLIRKYKISIV
ncbi:UNVERIFIED_CONTAM: hypothetical protein GTU68_017013 [Idotea baltica]|nr:hypothetical protein [Idotea baltica]